MINWTFRERLGVQMRIEGDTLIVADEQELCIREDLGGAVPKIDDAPWPQFPADLMSIALIVATQARGTVLMHEKMFESRLYFVDKLIGMGAKIILCDPHRAVIVGPSTLYGQELSSPDIRAGMALLIAALAAKGTSTIANVGQIDRGYQDIDLKLKALGRGDQARAVVGERRPRMITETWDAVARVQGPDGARIRELAGRSTGLDQPQPGDHHPPGRHGDGRPPPHGGRRGVLRAVGAGAHPYRRRGAETCAPGDTVVIRPGQRHKLWADVGEDVVLVVTCAPAYSVTEVIWDE